MAKENPNNVENKAEIPPVQTQAANGAPQTEASAVALSVDEVAKMIEKLGAQAEKLAESLTEIAKLVEKHEAAIEELKAHPRNAPTGNAVRSFVVIKEYYGIAVGEVIHSTNKTQIAHMVDNGYWEAE